MQKKIQILMLIMGSLFIRETFGFYGKQAVEATLSFQGKLELPEGLSEEEIEEKIDEQVLHLMGSFKSKSFIKKFGFQGVIGDGRAYKNIKVKNSEKEDRELVTYQYSSDVVFDKDAFGRKSKINIPIRLPLALDEIYELGMVGRQNKCTDKKYNSEGDFFYFWDPELKGCPLKGNSEDVLRIKGTLTKKKNTRRTYPVYKKLFGANGNGKETRIDIFFGYIEDKPPKSLTDYIKQVAKVRDHKASLDGVDDTIIAAYEVSDYLKGKGFSLKQTKEKTGNATRVKFQFTNPETKKRESVDSFVRTGEIFGKATKKELKSLKNRKILIQNAPNDSEGKTISEIRTYEKRFKSGKKVIVNIFIGDTDFARNDEKGETFFSTYLKDSLENADIIEYEGHSGLGGNLDLAEMYPGQQVMNPNKYQLIFLNGCSSYPYFRKMFFEHKGNGANLDLILSGLGTLASDGAPNSKAFLSHFLNPDKRRTSSFQKILNSIERSNGKGNGTYLTAVIGDTNKNNSKR